MELSKKKYAKSEVAEIINGLSGSYEEKLAEQKSRIAELVRENAEFRTELDRFYAQDKRIADSVKRAEEYSAEVKGKTDMQYSLAVERISAFLNKWDAYFEHLKDKYPMYPVVQNAIKIKDKISEIIGNKDAETVIYTADAALPQVKSDGAFNPKQKIADYIAATSDNGFNMDEVLNPGALRLEDLCKELGLLTENDL
nr:hypothetical protein [Clostridia bacterium]